MAARRSSTLDPRHRAAIRTAMLVKRLEAFALSKEDVQTGRPVEMSKAQVAAALGLLRKTLPDLATMRHVGADGGAVEVVYSWTSADVASGAP